MFFAMSDEEVAGILVGLETDEQFEWLAEHPEVDWDLERGEIVNNPNARVVDENRIYYTKQATSADGEGAIWLSFKVNYSWSVHSNSPSTTIAIESVKVTNVVKSCPHAVRYDGPTATYGVNAAVGYASSTVVAGVLCGVGYYELAQYGTLLPQGTTNIRSNWYRAA